MAISSIPITRGPGVPKHRSCSHMHCCSNSLTVFQSRCNSLAMSLTGDARQRRPTKKAKRFVSNGLSARKSSRFLLHRAATSCSQCAGFRHPNTPAYHRRRDPEPAAPCDRNRPAARARSPHTSFFSPPPQRNNPRLRITEKPDHSRPRPKASETIRIPQAANTVLGWHPRIMPVFRPAPKALPPAPRAAFRRITPAISPTHFHEDHFEGDGVR